MPAVQTTYNPRIAIGVPGMVRSMVNFNSITRFGETVAGIGFGLALSQGAADKGCILGGTLAKFLGVSMKDVTLPASPTRTVDKFMQYDHIGILTTGEIYVRTATAVVPADPVYFNATTGVFSNAAGAGLVGPIVGAKWNTTAGINEIAVLQLGIQR